MILAAFAILLLAPICLAEPAPTSDELRQLFNDGKYKELLPKLNKAIAAKGPGAQQYNKYDLLMLKGEASLHTHSRSSALDAFKQAAVAAAKPEDASIARATALLVQASSPSLKYLPKTKVDKNEKLQPIDIVETDSRKSAFESLQKDLAANVQPQVDQAAKSGTLTQIVATVKNLSNIKDIELAATGTDTDFKQMAGDLGTRASGMIDESLDKAKQQVESDMDAVKKAGRSGMMNFNRQADSISSNVAQIADAVKQLGDVFGDSVDFKPLGSKASEIQDEITKFRDEAKNPPR